MQNLFCLFLKKAETPRATRVLRVSVIAILKKSRDRLPTQETENASECSSQHLENSVISRFCAFLVKKYTCFERKSVKSVSMQGLQAFRASV